MLLLTSQTNFHHLGEVVPAVQCESEEIWGNLRYCLRYLRYILRFVANVALFVSQVALMVCSDAIWYGTHMGTPQNILERVPSVYGPFRAFSEDISENLKDWIPLIFTAKSRIRVHEWPRRCTMAQMKAGNVYFSFSNWLQHGYFKYVTDFCYKTLHEGHGGTYLPHIRRAASYQSARVI